jgi:hypothetical protein
MKGENGLDAQQRSEGFLQALEDRPGQIVVLKGSKWTEKAWELWEERDSRVVLLSKLLYLGILIDPLKCRYLNQDEITPLPSDLNEQVPDKDVYLFQTALAGGAETIVTSDERLIAMVTNAQRHRIQVRLRDEFVAEYLGL